MDDRFATYYNDVKIGFEFALSISTILDYLEYLTTIIHAVGKAAIAKHALATA